MKLTTYDSGKQKNIVAGEYNEATKTFIKKALHSHYMIIERGYGIQDIILQQLQNLGCDTIKIITKTGVHVSKLEDWLKQTPKNYNHGVQKFLKIK